MRTLLYVPMIHQKCEREIYTLSENASERMESHIKDYWKSIRERLDYYCIDKVYADSRSEAKEPLAEKMVNYKMWKDGSVYMDVILELEKKGASIMATEEFDLLAEADRNENEQKHVLDILRPYRERKKEPDATYTLALVAREMNSTLRRYIIEERDRHIARRVDETLEDGETGLLMMGAAHRPMFEPSIKVKYLYDPMTLMMEFIAVDLCSRDPLLLPLQRLRHGSRSTNSRRS